MVFNSDGLTATDKEAYLCRIIAASECGFHPYLKLSSGLGLRSACFIAHPHVLRLAPFMLQMGFSWFCWF